MTAAEQRALECKVRKQREAMRQAVNHLRLGKNLTAWRVLEAALKATDGRRCR